MHSALNKNNSQHTRWNTEKFGNIIDMYINRNYLGMRKYFPCMQDFRSQIYVVQLPEQDSNVSTTDYRKKKYLCDYCQHKRLLWNNAFRKSITVIIPFWMAGTPTYIFYSYSHLNYSLALETRSVVKCSFYLRKSKKSSPNYTIIRQIYFIASQHHVQKNRYILDKN